VKAVFYVVVTFCLDTWFYFNGNDTIKTSVRRKASIHSLPHASLAQRPSTLFACLFLKKITPACGDRLLALLDTAHGCPLQISVSGCRPCQAQRATACESWCLAAGPTRRGAWSLPPCCIAQPPPSACRLRAPPSRCLQESSGCCLRQTPHYDEPPFSQAVRRCCDVLKTHVAKVCYKCFRWMLQNKSEYCICCNSCTRMLQSFVPNVSYVFRTYCCKCVYLNVAYVSHICCKCFIWILHIFAIAPKCFSGAFFQVF
jgi:hypothetical protein